MQRCRTFPELAKWLYSLALGKDSKGISPLQLPAGVMWTSNKMAAQQWVTNGTILAGEFQRMSSQRVSEFVPPVETTDSQEWPVRDKGTYY